MTAPVASVISPTIESPCRAATIGASPDVARTRNWGGPWVPGPGPWPATTAAAVITRRPISRTRGRFRMTTLLRFTSGIFMIRNGLQQPRQRYVESRALSNQNAQADLRVSVVVEMEFSECIDRRAHDYGAPIDQQDRYRLEWHRPTWRFAPRHLSDDRHSRC